MVDEVTLGPYDWTHSMMSCSPHCGQPTLEIFAPSIQNAGHRPSPTGSFIRASMRPNWNCCRPWVFMRPEVQFPLESLALITRLLLPSWKMFGLAELQGAAFEPGAQ